MSDSTRSDSGEHPSSDRYSGAVPLPPSASDGAPIGSPSAGPKPWVGPELASPWLRLAAALLDACIGLLLWFAVAFALYPLIEFGVPEALGTIIYLITAFVLLPAYPIVAEGRLGQTYGKHIVGVRVVSQETGQPIGLLRAFGRIIVRVVGAYAFGLGLLWMLWDKQRQGWHDKVASDVVISVRQPLLSPIAYADALFGRRELSPPTDDADRR